MRKTSCAFKIYMYLFMSLQVIVYMCEYANPCVCACMIDFFLNLIVQKLHVVHIHIEKLLLLLINKECDTDIN